MVIKQRDFEFVRNALLRREEIAFLDVREEDPHAQAHPLFAANMPLSRLEIDALAKLPRFDVPVVTFDAGEGLAQIAAQRLVALGYTDVGVFTGGLAAWKAAGGEVFRDVNVPSKAFGELVEAERHTPSLPAADVKALIESGEDVVVVDARRFEEYNTMSIPTGISVPGAELVLRVPELLRSPDTRVIVNCAGRTRSIIGTQSLLDAGLPNPVHALRNGTIGWTLAGQSLDHGQERRFGEVSPDNRQRAAERARAVADRSGVRRASLDDVRAWQGQHGRTTWFFDVRSPEEYERGHLPGFRSAPGGQLVQETEMFAPARGGRIVLYDDAGVRADMSASWLARMAWDVYVLDGVDPAAAVEVGPGQAPRPPVPDVDLVAPSKLAGLLDAGRTVVVDLSTNAVFRRGHIPGAWWAIRSDLANAVRRLPHAERYVLTSGDGLLARLACPELAGLTTARVSALDGGTSAWTGGGGSLEAGSDRYASPLIDRYRRPYEGTDAPREAMEAYLEWEFGLVEQLGRDGTHHFRTR